MLRLSFFLLVILPQLAGAQENPSCYREHLDGDTAKVFTRINMPAQLQGGEYAWNKFIGSNTRFDKIEKLLPDSVNEFKDSVSLRFIVSKEGVISNIAILQYGRPVICEEAIRLVMASCEKKWIPGIDSSGAYRNSWVGMKFYYVVQADLSMVYTEKIDP